MSGDKKFYLATNAERAPEFTAPPARDKNHLNWLRSRHS